MVRVCTDRPGACLGQTLVQLRARFDPFPCSDVAYLYVKGDGADLSPKPDLETAVKGLNQNIQKLAEFCKKLGKRIAALEERGR